MSEHGHRLSDLGKAIEHDRRDEKLERDGHLERQLATERALAEALAKRDRQSHS